MTQINSPYPATAYLTAYLKKLGYQVQQRDLGLDLFLRLFSREGLEQVKKVLLQKSTQPSDRLQFFLDGFDDYASTVEPVIRFLQGKDPTLALRIAKRTLLPEGPRFIPLAEHRELLGVFGTMGVQDQAKYLASLYLDDLSDYIKEGIDPRFEFSRYGESLASSMSSFDPLLEGLHTVTLIDELLNQCVEGYFQSLKPDVVGFTMPFPGNVLGALKAAARFKQLDPKIKTLAGGGFVNTELRELSDVRFFDTIDFLIFDDGEKPLEILLKYLSGKSGAEGLVRTWYAKEGEIVKSLGNPRDNVPFKSLDGPTYEGLNLNDYVAMLELPNPMHRMWSDFRWNKMILAHGCYWKKCTFCDVSLDYIQRYEPARVDHVVNMIERLVQETGQRGFHFVDEAAPPAILKAMSEELLRRQIRITWWGNIRFDKQFTPEVARLMADAGCVAVTGGLEVASPRILELIQKGTTVEQVTEVAKAFSDAGIFVHAYLMYGFPTQTDQETIESLGVVRRLFGKGYIQSAFWHRFVATAHSPVGLNPKKYGIKLQFDPPGPKGLFAKNAIRFHDPTGTDHDRLGVGLRKAVYNYMHGVGLKDPVKVWFNDKTFVSESTIAQ